MLNVKLSPALEKAVEQQARREKKTKAALARAALERYVEEAADYKAVLAFRKRPGRTISLAAIKKRHGLEG